MPDGNAPIVLHDTLGLIDARPPRKPRARFRTGHVSRHDVLWKDVKPALDRPLRPWDRPLPRPTRMRTHGRAARRRAR